MASSSKIRAAVIGIGVGWNHIEGYQTHPHCELVAICDVNPQILKERGDRFNIPEAYRFTDYRDVLKSNEIDVVSIALPNWLHEAVALEAFAHGKHVLCEKPLAISVEAGRRMIEAAHSANKTLMVCYNHRYRPEIVWLKGEILSGDFGRIYAAKAGWLREGWIPTHGQWFTQKERAGGGALIDLGVHVLDLALWLMGYPSPVAVSGAAFAEFGPRGQKTKPREVKPAHFDVDDMGLGFIRFADGSVLQFESAWASHREPMQDSFYVRLFGSEAGANFYTGAPSGETVVMYKLVNDHPATIVPRLPTGFSGHRLAVHHFVDCVLSGATPESPGEHGLIGLQIIDAIYRSSREGREVRLA
ncbi:MAG: Gfo/Idh/MocA family oxidoreductase [Thermoflexales bacterium]|nr:Gfo/Idh/MocA family oxidoreductase [Thermoflexales bacterium]MDW8351028.1 Gfo/Idh/MocA family oxidoreductase [Anaerolineae bacterium]